MAMAMAVFQGRDEVIVCAVDDEGKPINVDQYFEEGTGRDREDYDLTLVEPPILIGNGDLRVEPERRIT